MNSIKSVADWMAERNLDAKQLMQAARLDKKIFQAILEGRYTPSPQQRQRVAGALGVDAEQVAWGHKNEVIHIYGHGPQFGRSP